MRIALVTHQFFPAFYTGVERLTLNLASQLSRMGHGCVVVTSADHSGEGQQAYSYEETWVRTVPAGETHLARPWLQDPRVTEHLTDILRDERIDVVHVMHPMRLPQAFEAAERLDLPAVAHIADFGYVCRQTILLRLDGSRCPSSSRGAACVSVCGVGSGPERYAWGKELLSRSAAVISPCRWTIERHAAEGFETAEWHHIPWGTDYAIHTPGLERPAGDELVVGFIGTLLRHKGPHVAIEAMKQLAGRPIRLLLYGGSFHEKEYEKELQRLAGDDERIVFAGSYDHGELAGILEGLDVVVIPSLWFENLPTVGLNAVAAGVPIITPDLGGMIELVDDYSCGFTYAADDAGALAALLRELCDKPELVDEVRGTLVLPPSLEEEAFRIESIYLELLSVGKR